MLKLLVGHLQHHVQVFKSQFHFVTSGEHEHLSTETDLESVMHDSSTQHDTVTDFYLVRSLELHKPGPPRGPEDLQERKGIKSDSDVCIGVAAK